MGGFGFLQGVEQTRQGKMGFAAGAHGKRGFQIAFCLAPKLLAFAHSAQRQQQKIILWMPQKPAVGAGDAGGQRLAGRGGELSVEGGKFRQPLAILQRGDGVFHDFGGGLVRARVTQIAAAASARRGVRSFFGSA